MSPACCGASEPSLLRRDPDSHGVLQTLETVGKGDWATVKLAGTSWLGKREPWRSLMRLSGTPPASGDCPAKQESWRFGSSQHSEVFEVTEAEETLRLVRRTLVEETCLSTSWLMAVGKQSSWEQSPPGGYCPQRFKGRKPALGCEHHTLASATNAPFTTSWTPSGVVFLRLPGTLPGKKHRTSFCRHWPMDSCLLMDRTSRTARGVLGQNILCSLLHVYGMKICLRNLWFSVRSKSKSWRIRGLLWVMGMRN